MKRSLEQMQQKSPLPPLTEPTKELAELQACMKSLIGKFSSTETGSEKKTTDKQEKITEIDISYPSFLDFFAKKCIELSQSEVVKRMEKAKQELAEKMQDLTKRIELAKTEYYPQFHYAFHSSVDSSFFPSSSSSSSSSEGKNQSVDAYFRRDYHDYGGWSKVEFDVFREAEGETAVDGLIEDVIPIIQSSWWGNEGTWVKIAWRRKQEWEKRSRKWDKLFTLQPNKKSSDPTDSSSAEVSDKESPLAKSSHRGVLNKYHAPTTDFRAYGIKEVMKMARRGGVEPPWRKVEKFEWYVKNVFCVAMDDPTVQQRMKSLLILRAITDRGLNGTFGVGKLQKIALVESNRDYLDDSQFDYGHDGQYVIELDFSGDVTLSKLRFFKKAMHRIYHNVIDPWQAGPVHESSRRDNDVLAMMGSMPVDIAPNERYRIIDHQNLSEGKDIELNLQEERVPLEPQPKIEAEERFLDTFLYKEEEEDKGN